MMNYAVQRMAALPFRSADAGTAVRFVVVPAFTQRAVLVYVKARCAEADVLSVLQPVGSYRFTAVDGSDTAKVPDMPADFAGKLAVIRFDGGKTLCTEIKTVTDEGVTFAQSLEGNEAATVYVMADGTDGEKMSFAVAEDGTELCGENGFACGAELGYPLVLEMENADGKSLIEGGLAVFAGV